MRRVSCQMPLPSPCTGDKGGQSRFRGGLDFTGLSWPHPSATYGLLPGGPPSLLTLLRTLSSLMSKTGTCAANMLEPM